MQAVTDRENLWMISDFYSMHKRWCHQGNGLEKEEQGQMVPLAAR